jgi:hypothetical protein
MSNRLDFPLLAKPAAAGPVPLASVAAGDRVWQVLAVRCPVDQARVLAAEGVEPGSRIQVVCHERQGVVALRVRCRLLLLGHRFPPHIEVIPLPEPARGAGHLIPFAPGGAPR